MRNGAMVQVPSKVSLFYRSIIYVSQQSAEGAPEPKRSLDRANQQWVGQDRDCSSGIRSHAIVSDSC